MGLVIAAVLAAPAAQAGSALSPAASFVSTLRTLPTVVTSETDAKRVLGAPQREAGAGDGMSVLIYAPGDGVGSSGGIGGFADLAGMAAWLMPTQLGMATETVSAVAGMGSNVVTATAGKGRPRGDYAILMLFDREGRLVGWKGTADGQPVRSSDGGTLSGATDEELQQAGRTLAAQPAPTNDGKPHLGARVILVPGGITLSEAKAQAERTGMCGLLIMSLAPGSPAERAGLRLNDLVFVMDGDLIATADDLQHVLTRAHAGKAMNVLYYRIDPAKNEWAMAQAKVTF
jgi:membrane-associated protease RseP (regulator of RpoE activity)